MITDKNSEPWTMFENLMKTHPGPLFSDRSADMAGQHLTYLPLDKMAAILADDIFNCIFLSENVKILIQISLKYVSRSPIDNTPAMVYVMAWHQTSDKPFPGPMLTHFMMHMAQGGDELIHGFVQWPELETNSSLVESYKISPKLEMTCLWFSARLQ